MVLNNSEISQYFSGEI